MAQYFRGNLFTNTPDILPFHLQTGGRATFQIRAVLAATLSSVYGIYSGFELCENAALPGREEYLDSEKYQLKERDWNAPGNIKELISKLNRIRNENRALHFYNNLRFHPVDNEALLFYSKITPARDSVILIIVNLDPLYTQSGNVETPVELFGEIEGDRYEVQDLLTDERYLWHGRRNYVALHPSIQPAHILRVRRAD
jgi:starch synthase (maltosyl-transferring)